MDKNNPAMLTSWGKALPVPMKNSEKRLIMILYPLLKYFHGAKAW
jgi:hypothetical protein